MQTIENNTPKVRSIRMLRQWIQQGQLPAGEQLPPEIDLARLLNVSRTTVRAAVKSIEEEGLLRYQENRRRIVVGTAQRNGTLMSNTVVILTNIEDNPADHDPLQSASGWVRYIQVGLVDAIQQTDLHALTLQVKLLQKALIKSIVAERPRGLVIMRPSMHPPLSIELAETLRAAEVPVVCYDSAERATFDTIASDHASGCYDLTKWLISKGRRRIQLFWPMPEGGQHPEWQRQRRIGYERAMTEGNLKPLPTLEYPAIKDVEENSLTEFQTNTRVMLGYLYERLNGAEPVDALMALTDGACFSMASACRALGKEPGKDISIVGYDNYWPSCPYKAWEPFAPQATVDKLNIKLGQELMSLLLLRAQGSLPPEPQQRLIKPELRVTGEA